MKLPLEIIYYIYEFDSTYREKMDKVLLQLKDVFESYKIEYTYNKAMLRKLIFKGCFYDNNCYYTWMQYYGFEYNPIKYILVNNQGIENT